MTKYCRHCETVLPVDQFHRNSRRPDGRATYCRKCMASIEKEWYERTQKPKVAAHRQAVEKERERIRKLVKKKCSKCKKTLPRSAFNRQKDSLDGLQTYCRPCFAAHQQEYYEANPDKHSQRKRRQSLWQQNLGPEKKKAARLRALLGRHNITNEEHTALYERCGHCCQVCNLPASENTWKGLSGQLCLDHVLVAGKRVVRGLLCNRCNSLLGRMDDDRAGVIRYVGYLERYQASMKDRSNGA